MQLPIDVPHGSGSVSVHEFGCVPELFAVLDHDEVWAHIPRGRPDSAATLAARLQVSDRQALVIRRDETIVGTSSFIIDRADPEGIEIGATLLAPEVWGTGVNTEAKRLMLATAFASGAQWAQFRTDERNARSVAAILKLPGAAELEPRREPHVVRADGTVRTSRVFRILAPG